MEFISNFNGLELIFILILALLLFGPEKIPEIASKLGSWARSLRNFSRQFMASLSEEAGLNDLTEDGSSLTDSIKDTASELNQAAQTIRSPAKTLKKSLNNQLSSTPVSSEEISDETPTATPQKTKKELEQRLVSLEEELQKIRTALAADEPDPQQDASND
jgi:sec-independent protein translocase protein TatB